MALLKVNAGGKTYIIECANKGTAKAYGREKLEVEVTEATGADVTEFLGNGGTIETVVPKEVKKADEPAAAAA